MTSGLQQQVSRAESWICAISFSQDDVLTRAVKAISAVLASISKSTGEVPKRPGMLTVPN